MAYTRGRCVNIDYCSLAAARRDIEVKIGQDFACPECSHALRPPPLQTGSGRNGLVVAGIAGVAVLAAGGLYAGYRLTRSPAQQAAAPAPLLAASAPASTQALPHPGAPPVAVAPPPAPVPAPPAGQAVLLRLDGPAWMVPLMSRLATAYLASLGDSELATAAGGSPSERLVTGMRVGRPESISVVAGDGRAEPPAQLRLQVSAAPQTAGSPTVAFSPASVVVNARNRVASLTEVQLRGVLDGSIANWSQLGGTGGTIHLVQSADPAASGLSALIPGTPPTPASAPRVADAAAQVAADPDALALLPGSSAAVRAGTRLLAIAALGARPALPTPAEVAQGQYPLVRRVSFAMPAGQANAFAARFAAFALSPEGQDAVARAGLVPLHVAAEAPPAPAAPPTAKDRYRALVTGATRLTANLHFEPNSNKLDLYSSREVDRVWNFMMSDHTPPDHLVLLGFADNQGTAEANLALSQQRAQAVAAVFARRGLPPGQVVAFGADLPVADNTSEAGREKNRRVEVFLRN